VGAIIGEATGHPVAGALVGAGVGTVTGAAIGSSLDEAQARNQAMIAASRTVPPGTMTVREVIDMSRSQLDEDLIINQIRANGLVGPLTTGDLIVLQQNGVSKRVIEAMQARPFGPAPVVVRVPGPPPVLVDRRFVGPPYPYPYPYYPPPPW
jgi:hypothetical protein